MRHALSSVFPHFICQKNYNAWLFLRAPIGFLSQPRCKLIYGTYYKKLTKKKTFVFLKRYFSFFSTNILKSKYWSKTYFHRCSQMSLSKLTGYVHYLMETFVILLKINPSEIIKTCNEEQRNGSNLWVMFTENSCFQIVKM